MFTLWFVLEFCPPTATIIQESDTPLIELGRQWHHGATVGSIFSKVAAFAVLLVAGNFFAWRSYRRVGRTGGVL